MHLKEKEHQELRQKMDSYLKNNTPLGKSYNLCSTFFSARELWHKKLTPEPYRTPIPRRLYYMVDHGWLHLEALYFNILPWVFMFEDKVNETLALNEAEWFVLVSSAYLHDCGMNMPDYMEDEFLDSLGSYEGFFHNNVYLISKTSRDIAEQAKRKGRISDKEYRKLHPDFGAWWVALCEDKLIPQAELKEMSNLVAKVVCLHGREGADKRKDFLSEDASFMGDRYTVRVGLLAAIIAVADGCLLGREWVDDLSDTEEKEKNRIKMTNDLLKEYETLKSITRIDEIGRVEKKIKKFETDRLNKLTYKISSIILKFKPTIKYLGISAGEKRASAIKLIHLEKQLDIWGRIKLLRAQNEHYLRHIVIRKIALQKDRIVIIPNYRNDDEIYIEFAESDISFGEYSTKPGNLIDSVMKDIIEEVSDANDLFKIIKDPDGTINESNELFPKKIDIIQTKKEADKIVNEVEEQSRSLLGKDLISKKISQFFYRLTYQFMPYGTAAPPDLVHSNTIYLDVGQDCRIGVLDHHHYDVFQASATQLVANHPEYVRQAVNPYRKDELTFIVHRNPDLDAVAAVAIALDTLEHDPDDAARRLARYVDLVDSGRLGASHGNPFSLYSAYAQVLQNLSEKMGSVPDDKEEKEKFNNRFWTSAMKTGVELVRFVLKEIRDNGMPVDKINAFKCPDCLSYRDGEFVKCDLQRYNNKLADPTTKMQIVPLHIPLLVGGTHKVNGLFVRNVQSLKDPERVMFFKDWARADFDRNPSEGGFSFLCITEENEINGNARCWISLRTNDGLELTGLGEKLEAIEANARIAKYEKDTRWFDPNTGEEKTVRKGFNNPDPWYDGRGHDYTIIETPNDGTVFSADEIESILVDVFSDATSIKFSEKIINFDALLSLSDRDKAKDEDGQGDLILASQVQKLDLLFNRTLSKQDLQAIDPNNSMFISFPEKHRMWVKENIFELIKEKFNKQKIYFEAENTQPGLDWLELVGNAIQASTIFIPILCSDYEKSPLCRWEYQKAQKNYIQNKKPLLIPILFDGIGLSDYLARQALISIKRKAWQNDLLDLILINYHS